MPSDRFYSRRAVLASGAIGVGGALAGCLSSGGDDGGDGNGTGDGPDGIPAPETTWPMFRGDRYNSGWAPGLEAIADPVVEWEYETDGSIWGSPVVEGTTVYVTSYDGYLHAIDFQTGEREWRFEVNAIADGTPAVYDGDIVVVGSFDQHLYGVDAADGSQVWAYDAGGIVRSSPTIVEDTVYVGAHCHNFECVGYDVARTGEVLALDAASGDRLWSHEVNKEVIPTPAVGESLVYVGSSTSEVLALSRTDGEVEWRYDTDDWVIASPVLDDGTLYAGDLDGVLYALDAQTGEDEWVLETESIFFSSSPAIDDERLYVGESLLEERTEPTLGSFSAYTRDGEHDWRRFVETTEIGSSPVVVDGQVYVGSHLGPNHDPADYATGFHAFEPDGTEVWKLDVGGRGVGGSPAAVDGAVVYGTVPGKVVAVTPEE